MVSRFPSLIGPWYSAYWYYGFGRSCYYYYAIIWIERTASTVDKRTVDNYRNTTHVALTSTRVRTRVRINTRVVLVFDVVSG